MPVPADMPSHWGQYLGDLEDRLSAREQAQTPFPVFACATLGMPPAANYANCVLRNTTLNILAVSDGTNWIRQDTGAAI